jgi:PKD repeat protein
MGRLFQLAVFNEEEAELREVAYVMEINKSAFDGITVFDAVIVMTAPATYVDVWGGADSFTILSVSQDGVVSHLETTYTLTDGIYTFTALSPDGFSFKALVSINQNEIPVAHFSAIPVEGSAPLMVQFYDYSNGHPETWAWDFGDGTTSTEQNPLHTYTTTGVYDVAFTVTNPVGTDTIEETGYIIITNPMTVDFTATPLVGYAPLRVTFTDNTVGSPSAWLWDFGDGETSLEQNPAHIYQRAGTYPISLTVTNGYGDITTMKAGYITARYYSGSDSGDSPTPFVTSIPTQTPLPTTVQPTIEPTVSTNPTPGLINPDEFTGTAQLPLDSAGAAERGIIIWVDDMSGFLSIDAGVTARDTSGIPQDTISIVAVPVTLIPSPGEIGSIEHPGALYAFECTPDGMTFSPAISLSFVLSEEEWNLYGSQAEVGWFNSATGVWEVVAGVADADTRTITIEISHFSTYALFAELVPQVPMPDVTKVPGGKSNSSSLRLLGGFFIIIALGVGGYLVISKRKVE